MITYSQIIVAAKQRLRISDTSEYDALLESWIYDGVRAARWPTTKIIKNARVDVVDLKAKLPCDYSKFIAMQLDCSDIIYYSSDFYGCCTSGCSEQLGRIGQVINGYIHFGSAVEADEVDIAYLALNTDNDGAIILHDEDELPLTYYLCKEYALVYMEGYQKYQIQKWDELFVTEANNARGIKNRDKLNKDVALIGSIMNSIVERGGNISGLRNRLAGTRFV